MPIAIHHHTGHVPHPREPDGILPCYKTQEILMSSEELGELPYVKAPHLLFLDEHNILVGYKRGTRHNNEPAADWEVFHYDPLAEVISNRKIVAHQEGFTLQNGEFARFANGDIGLYVDPHFPNSIAKHGLVAYRSADNGMNFEEEGKVGLINGLEYVYAFECLTEGDTTWMLATPYRHYRNLKGPPKVDLLRSDDNGKSWQFVKSLREEFGNAPLSESSIIRFGGEYLFATRGKDPVLRLHVTDSEFNLVREADLTQAYACIASHLGRPRLFEREGRYYLIGRNYTNAGPDGVMKLFLFRIDPESLEILSYAVLDNYEGVVVPDGYYAMPYFVEREGTVYFNAITYKSLHNRGRPPDLIRLEFRWEELR